MSQPRWARVRLLPLAAVAIIGASAIASAGQVPLPIAAPTEGDHPRLARGPFDAAAPRPEEVLGFRPGEDFRLADWPTILRYLRELDAASDRMRLEEIGRSAMGQPLVVALLSAPENLERAERYRRIAERLARARELTEAEAVQLAAEGKAVVWIDCGLHATEVAHGQLAPELAYTVAAGESAELRRIRRDVILLLMPNMNPDGLNMVVEWYRQNLGTPFETSPLPRLYHKYVGHDNNRDWYMITQPETVAVSRVLYRTWYPQIVYNHHQVAPFPARIFVPPFADPANPNIPPLVMRGVELVGNAIKTRLEAEGKPGAISRIGFTAWWDGGMRTVPYFHNMVGILTETALYRYATPHFYAPSSLPERFANGWPTMEPSVDYPMPWRGGWWRLRDAVDYMLTASLATLDVASRYRDQWLLNIYRMGREAIAAGERGYPSGWVIPPDQWDRGAAAELVNALLRGGLEVYRATVPLAADGVEYPAGSLVVPAAQAFRGYALDLLEPQRYPERRRHPEAPPEPPYDMAGWTLPFQMGVRVDRLEAPFAAELEAVTEPVRPPGEVLGRGGTFLVDPSTNATAAATNRLLAAGETLYWLGEATTAGDRRMGPGAVMVEGGPGLGGRMARLAEELGLTVVAVPRRPRGRGWQLAPPRIGLYDPWVANMDAGWTRWLLERYEFPYTVLRDAVVRKGRLRRRFDVIVLPSARARTLREGHRSGTMPLAYVGGLGEAGLLALEEFVAAGGTLVCLDEGGDLAIESLGLPVVDAVGGLSRQEFFCPGSLLRLRVDPNHPVAFGMPERATAFFVNSNAYLPATLAEEGAEPPQLRPGQAVDGVTVIAAYPARGELLESGWILGPEHLRGRAAVVEVERGRGRVLLLGFRTQFRGQPHETFKLLFNSLFYAAAQPVALP